MNSERLSASTRREPSLRWWCAAAEAQSSAILENGSLLVWSSMKRTASAADGVSQKVRITRSILPVIDRFRIALTTM